MKEEKNIKFAELLKKRSLLSEAKKKNTKIISSSDPQLMDILKNFNESKDYKSLKKYRQEQLWKQDS